MQVFLFYLVVVCLFVQTYSVLFSYCMSGLLLELAYVATFAHTDPLGAFSFPTLALQHLCMWQQDTDIAEVSEVLLLL